MKERPVPLLAALLMLIALPVAFLVPAMGEPVVLLPVEDAFIRGGSHSQQPSPGKLLQVAARSRLGTELVRKCFLLFEGMEEDLQSAASATLVLAFLGDGLIANDGDPLRPFEIILHGIAGGDWMQDGLTWENAPFHDPESSHDEFTEGLELLAEIPVEPMDVAADGTLEVNDPRILKFLRENPGHVTFLLTSRGEPGSPGLQFFSKSGTGVPARKPRLIFQVE